MGGKALLGKNPRCMHSPEPAIEFERAQELEVKPGKAQKDIERTTFLETVTISVKTTHLSVPTTISTY